MEADGMYVRFCTLAICNAGDLVCHCEINMNTVIHAFSGMRQAYVSIKKLSLRNNTEKASNNRNKMTKNSASSETLNTQNFFFLML